MADRLLTVRDVADRSALGTRAVYRAIERGELRASRLCGRLRITGAAYSEWLESNIVAPATANAASDMATSAHRGRLRAVLEKPAT